MYLFVAFDKGVFSQLLCVCVPAESQLKRSPYNGKLPVQRWRFGFRSDPFSGLPVRAARCQKTNKCVITAV